MRSSRLGPLAVAVVFAGCSGRSIDVGSNDSGDPSHDAAASGTAPTRTSSGGGGVGPGPDADGDPCVSIEADSIAIRQRSCAPCHSTVGLEAGSGELAGQGGFNFVLDDAKLATSFANVAMDDAGMHLRLVVPGDPEDSYLYQRVVSGQMPPPQSLAAPIIGPSAVAHLVYPNASDESILYEWILSCMGVNGRALRASDASYGPGDDGSVVDTGPSRDAGTPEDASQTSDTGPIVGDAAAPPPGLAGFAFVVDGAVQTPLKCPSDNWEYNALDRNGQSLSCGPACPSGTTATLMNTGPFPVAYIALPAWSTGSHYVPGVLTGDPRELVGVLDPGGRVDITSSFAGGITALLGSRAPFSSADAGKYVSDEGTIPWPAGVAGSGGATQMQVAEIEVRSACGIASQEW